MMQVPRMVFAAFMAMALCGAPAVIAQQPVKIRVSGGTGIELGLHLAGEERSGQAPGKSYTLEATRYAGTPPMVTAVANGELEIANSPIRRSASLSTMPASTICA